MVGYERVALLFVRQGGGVQVESVAVMTDDVVQESVEKVLLNIQIGLALHQLGGDGIHRNSRHDGRDDGTEIRVGKQLPAHLRQFFGRVGAYFVKFGGDRLVHGSFLVWCCCKYTNFFQKQSSMMSVITSFMSSPAARTCCGIKLVAVMPGVVFISSRLIFSPSVMM